MAHILLSSVTPSTRTGSIKAKMEGAFALIKARLGVASGRLAHHRVFGHLDDDVWFSVNTTAYRKYAILRKVLPSLPDAQTQRHFIGSDGDRALNEAFRAYQLIDRIAARCGRPVTGETTILDVGCGWGAYDPLLHARCPNWPAPRRRCDGARCRSLAADQSLVPLFPRSRLAPVAPAREKSGTRD